MLGERQPSIDSKGMQPMHAPDGSPQHIDMPHQQIVVTPLQ